MKIALNLAAVAALGGLTLAAQTTPPVTKVGTINIQQAIIATKDGQKAAQDLQAKFDPKRKELEAKQQTIAQLRDQYQKSSNAASEEQKQKLARDIDEQQKRLQRDTEDAQAEFEQEQSKVINEVGGRLMQVIDKFARDNSYTLILDVSSQQTPVLYIANGIDVTQEIVKLYDANAPSTIAPAKPAAAPVRPAAPPAAAPKKPAEPKK